MAAIASRLLQTVPARRNPLKLLGVASGRVSNPCLQIQPFVKNLLHRCCKFSREEFGKKLLMGQTTLACVPRNSFKLSRQARHLEIARVHANEIAELLDSALVLDDHLVSTDPDRLAWFNDLLRKVARTTQVIVLTCRPHDYACTDASVLRDIAGGRPNFVDAQDVVRRWEPSRTIAPAAGLL